MEQIILETSGLFLAWCAVGFSIIYLAAKGKGL
jgi:hypothetical protein